MTKQLRLVVLVGAWLFLLPPHTTRAQDCINPGDESNACLGDAQCCQSVCGSDRICCTEPSDATINCGGAGSPEKGGWPCVRCPFGGQCGADDDCAAGLVCGMSARCCGVSTDLDISTGRACGAECGPCPDGSRCLVPSDCRSGVCVTSQGTNAAICMPSSSQCGACDANGDGKVTIAEILAGVNDALSECKAPPPAQQP